MTSSAERPFDLWIAKNLTLVAIATVLVGALAVRLRFGWPAVLLWLAFCALSGAVFLFWESMRAALDPEARGEREDDPDLREFARIELEERKRAALRALRDVREEHALGKLSEADFIEIETRYRKEARQVLQSLDDLLGDRLASAEREFDRIAAESLAIASPERTAPKEAAPKEAAPASDAQTTVTPPFSTVADGKRSCAKCETLNDVDARFCKSCGQQFASEVA
jgi:hypothetical protein